MRFFQTLKQRLLFYLLLCSIAPSLGIIFCITYIGNKAIKKQIFEELHELTILMEGNIHRFLNGGKQLSTLLASEKYIRNEVELFDREGMFSEPAQKELCQYLNSRCNLLDGIITAIILNKKGIVVASGNRKDLNKNRPEISYVGAVKDAPIVSEVYFSEEYRCGVIDFIAPILNEKDGKALGLLIIKVDTAELDAITTGEIPAERHSTGRSEDLHHPKDLHTIPVRRGDGIVSVPSGNNGNKPNEAFYKIVRKGATREAYLVNKEGFLITASRFMKDAFLKQRINTDAVHYSLKYKEAFTGIYKDYRSVWVIGFSRVIKNTDWVLLMETDWYEAFHPVKRMRFIAQAIFAVCIGSIFILTYFAATRILRYISSVEGAIRNISRGDLNTHLTDNSQVGNELGRVFASLNEMTSTLKQSKDALRNLFDAANDPMFILRNGEIIEDMNKRVTEILGYEKEELTGLSLARILRPNNIPMVKQAIASTWELSPGQKHPTFDVFVITCEGKELICELDLNRTAYGIQPHLRDVTNARRMEGIIERKKQELESALINLKETQVQLIQAGKLAGIGELASGVAHEINNPLTAVMGHAMRLLRKAESDALKDMKALDTFRTELKIIADASLRCKKIIDSLLRFSRLSTELKKSSVDLNAVVDDTLIIIESTLKQKRIHLMKQLDPNLRPIMGDHNQLQQVFLNIVNNAIYAMPNGGNLIIAARKIHDDYVVVEFTDTGCGIKEEYISKIFDPFFTTKEPGKGTGLGLSISYRIIKDHGGRIEVKTTEGKGTSFFVTLPTDVRG